MAHIAIRFCFPKIRSLQRIALVSLCFLLLFSLRRQVISFVCVQILFPVCCALAEVVCLNSCVRLYTLNPTAAKHPHPHSPIHPTNHKSLRSRCALASSPCPPAVLSGVVTSGLLLLLPVYGVRLRARHQNDAIHQGYRSQDMAIAFVRLCRFTRCHGRRPHVVARVAMRPLTHSTTLNQFIHSSLHTFCCPSLCCPLAWTSY